MDKSICEKTRDIWLLQLIQYITTLHIQLMSNKWCV